MRIYIAKHFLDMAFQTGCEDAKINEGFYTIDEIRDAAVALQFLIDAMENEETD